MLRPFFTFYGGKWRAAPFYPAPRHDTVVEPFAGSAGYALRYPDRKVVLVERDPLIAATWRYLLRVSEREVLALPDVPLDGGVDNVNVCREARLLIGWWLNKGSAQPKRAPGANMRRSLLGLEPRDPPSSWWGEVVRKRIASQLHAIRHWKLIEGPYAAAPDMEATWFIDPPYEKAGKHYRYGPEQIVYPDLATWCRARRGQVIVCENVGADWLPFKPWRDVKASEARYGGKVSREAIWTNDLE